LRIIQIMEERHEFRLSAKEFKYLKELASRDKSVANLLGLQEGTDERRVTIRLSRAEAEQLRESLTTQLAAVGFDENYLPNEQGRILEELIDRFYL
jgi:hypothetical protein